MINVGVEGEENGDSRFESDRVRFDKLALTLMIR